MGTRIVAPGCGLAAALLLLCASPATAADRGGDGRFSERRSAHFVLRQDVDFERRSASADFERAVLGVLEAGYDRLDELLGLRPRRALAVWIYDPGFFDAQFAGLFPYPAAGFYHGAIRVRGDLRVGQALVRTLHHELVHAALDAEAPSLVLPAWLNEGLAEWFEARATGRRALSAAEARVLAQASASGDWIPLPALSAPSFGGLRADAAGLAYLESRAALQLLEQRRGPRGIEELVELTLRLRDVDRALRRSHRTSVAELDASLREALR
jgi:hypothetical protein